MGKFQEHFVLFPKFTHFFLQNGQKIAHFEKKWGNFKKNTKKIPKCSHDFS